MYFCDMGTLLTILFLLGLVPGRGALTPKDLRVAAAAEPAAVEAEDVRFSWIAEPKSDKVAGEGQTAWQVRVATHPLRLLKGKADLWDSGKVPGDASHLVPYGGVELPEGKTVYWTVRIWDSKGRPSRFAPPATFGTALRQWKAQWIGAPWFDERGGDAFLPAPEFRKTISIRGRIRSARAHVSGLGWFELALNGKKVGDDCYVPGFTDYAVRPWLSEGKIPLSGRFAGHRTLYMTYDLPLRQGENSLTILVGNGFFNPDFRSRRVSGYGSPRLICQVEIDYADGRHETVATDLSWEVRRSGTVLNELYLGETCDARVDDAAAKSGSSPASQAGNPALQASGPASQAGNLALHASGPASQAGNLALHAGSSPASQAGNPALQASGPASQPTVSPWEPVVPRKAPEGPLRAVPFPADRVAERLAPISMEKQPDGAWKVDFGRTVTGRVALSGLKGEPGDTVRVRFISEERQGEECYIMKGPAKGIRFRAAGESWAPRFCWFVFRECLVDGPESLRPENIRAEDIHAGLRSNATLTLSDTLLQHIETVFRRTQLQNSHSGYASDCPHREKLPYTGDGQVAMPAVLGCFDAETFYDKWIADMRLARCPDGYVPNGAPWEPNCGGGTAWGAAICIMPWEHYLRYGDRRMLADNLVPMRAYLGYLLGWRRPDGTVCQARGKHPGERPFKWYNLGDWCAPGELPDAALVHTFYAWYCADILAQAEAVLGGNDDAQAALVGMPAEAALGAPGGARAVADSLAEAFHRVFYDPETGSYGPAGSNVFALRMGVPADRRDRVLAALQAELAGGHLTTGIFATRFLPEVLAAEGLSDLAYTVLTQKGFPGFSYMFENGADTLWEQWDGGNSHNHPMFGGFLSWCYTTLAGIRFDPAAPAGRHVTIQPVLPAALGSVRYETRTPYGTLASDVRRDSGTIRMRVTVPAGCTADVHVPTSPDAFLRPADPALWHVVTVTQGTHSF